MNPGDSHRRGAGLRLSGMTSLFDPIRFGDIALANRIVMAPLTRNRAPSQQPNDLMREYYTSAPAPG